MSNSLIQKASSTEHRIQGWHSFPFTFYGLMVVEGELFSFGSRSGVDGDFIKLCFKMFSLSSFKICISWTSWDLYSLSWIISETCTLLFYDQLVFIFLHTEMFCLDLEQFFLSKQCWSSIQFHDAPVVILLN